MLTFLPLMRVRSLSQQRSMRRSPPEKRSPILPVSRARSKIICASKARPAPRPPACLNTGYPRMMRLSSKSWKGKTIFLWARRIWMNSPWALRPSAPPSDLPAIRGIRTMYRAVPPVALRQLSQRMKPSGPSARTRADLSVSRRPSTASSV